MSAIPFEAAHEPQRIGVALRCALAVAGVGLFFTNVDSYAAAAWSAPVPSLWVLAFGGAAVSLLLLNARHPVPLLRSPLIAWICLYFLVTTAWAIWSPTFLPVVYQELRDRYRSIILLFAFVVLFDEPRARRAGIFAVAIGVALASIINVAELLSLVTFADTDIRARVSGRAAGFYINPNQAGMAIALGSAVVAPALPRAWRAPLLLLASIGVVATFSRSAAFCLGLVFLWVVARGTLRPKHVALVAFCAVLLFMFAPGYVQEHGLLNENTATRVRLEHGDSGRVGLAMKAWGFFARSPLTGNGLGSTETWDIAEAQAHNMFLKLAADHGVLGLILFPALAVALVASRRSAAVYALALMAAGFANHTLLESRYALLLTALASARTTDDPGTPDDVDAP